jgi:hypothetical protein
LFYIDTRAFVQGGVLDIDLQIAPNSATDGPPRGATGLGQFRATVTGNVAEAGAGGERTIRLAPDSATADRSATIVAPGNGQHYYNTFFIDTRSFLQGQQQF